MKTIHRFALSLVALAVVAGCSTTPVSNVRGWTRRAKISALCRAIRAPRARRLPSCGRPPMHLNSANTAARTTVKTWRR